MKATLRSGLKLFIFMILLVTDKVGFQLSIRLYGNYTLQCVLIETHTGNIDYTKNIWISLLQMYCVKILHLFTIFLSIIR